MGPGAGANLGFYAPGVRWIGVEPNPWAHDYLRRVRAEVDGRGPADRRGAPLAFAPYPGTAIISGGPRQPPTRKEAPSHPPKG